jgi:hypothetical protein
MLERPPSANRTHSLRAVALSAAATASSRLLRVAVSFLARFLTPPALPLLVFLALEVPGIIARLLKRALRAPSIRFRNGCVAVCWLGSLRRSCKGALPELGPGIPSRDASEGTDVVSASLARFLEGSLSGDRDCSGEGRVLLAALNLYSSAGREGRAKASSSHWRLLALLSAPHIGASWKTGAVGNSRLCGLLFDGSALDLQEGVLIGSFCRWELVSDAPLPC